MKKIFKKSFTIATIAVLIVLSVFFVAFSLYLVDNLNSVKKDLKVKETELTTLKNNPPEDPLVRYALNLFEYDSHGAKSLPYICYEPKRPTNMSPKDEYWYNAATHYPPFPEDNANINTIQNGFKKSNLSTAYRICISPVADDYLVLHQNLADLYRFNKDHTYEVFNVSDKFQGFDIIAWLNNGNMIYSLGGANSIITYVFTSDNKDILLEYCENYLGDSETENFKCKSFNEIGNTSKYVPDSYLRDHLMPSYE